MLRLKGRNIEENPHVKMGAYHTIDLELHKKFTLQKPLWDSVHLERIELATDPGRSADVAALIDAVGSALPPLPSAQISPNLGLGTCGAGLEDGWLLLLSILWRAATKPSLAPLVPLAFRSTQLIASDFLPHLPPACLPAYVEVAAAFVLFSALLFGRGGGLKKDNKL